MIVRMTNEVKDALEVLANAPPAAQVNAAHILLRSLSTNADIGVVGRGFLRESFKGIVTVMDWMAVGGLEATEAIHAMVTKEVSL